MVVQFRSDNGNATGLIPFARLSRSVSGHIPALDGLRGIAILLVVVFHVAWTSLPLPGLAGRILAFSMSFGWIGVELFFVLSGFLITGILLDSKGAENYFSSFFARRALRILPLSYATLLVGFILCPLLGILGVPFFPTQFSRDQLWYWFYAGNWAWLRGQTVGYLAHFWSLAVEEQFYLIWPCVVLLASRRTLARVCLILVLAAPVIRILLSIKNRDSDGMWIYYGTFSHLDTLGLGALAALIVRDENCVRRLVPRLKYFIHPGWVIFCILGVVNGSFSEGPVFILGTLSLAVCFTGLLLLSVATTGTTSVTQKVLLTGWLRSWGKYSYAIYIFHWPLARIYSDTILPYLLVNLHHTAKWNWLRHPSLLSVPILATLAIIQLLGPCWLFFCLGKFSWRVFECPLNGLKRHFMIRWKTELPKSAKA